MRGANAILLPGRIQGIRGVIYKSYPRVQLKELSGCCTSQSKEALLHGLPSTVDHEEVPFGYLVAFRKAVL